MAVVKTSHYSIFDYWKNKWIYRDGVITKGVVPTRNVPCELVVEDWGEPCCWACGRIARKLHREIHYQEWLDGPEDGYKQIWNNKLVKSDLNRCHIIPNMLGGEDSPRNLFLMCSECHQLSPDSDNPVSFFRWVYKRRQQTTMGKLDIEYAMDMINEELKDEGFLGIDGIVEIVKLHMGDDDFYKYLDRGEKGSLMEYLKKHAGLHASAIADSTLICCISDYLKEMYISAISPTTRPLA